MIVESTMTWLCHTPGVAVSVVVPVYQSPGTLHQLVERIEKTLREIDFEVLLIDDGSGPSTWGIIQEIAASDPKVRGIRLGRNSGQHNALVAGVRHAQHEITVTLDDDLQNPPEEIPRLLRVLEESSVDVVYGVPRQVAQHGWRRASGWTIRRTMQFVLGVDEAVNMSSFRAFRTQLRNAFSANLGPGVSLDALLAWGTDRFAAVPVDHSERLQGRSNYSVRKLINFAVDAVTGYTTLPLRAASALGFVTAAGGLVLMGIFVIAPFVRGISVQGFPFLASTIILFAGIQLVTLGVIGEYLARMHFRIMNRPEYLIVEETDVVHRSRADGP